MYESKRLAVLLHDTEPTRSIRGIRRFVDSGGDLPLDHRADFVVDAGGNRDILLHPRRVRDDGEFDRREVLGLEAASFFVGPRECLVV